MNLAFKPDAVVLTKAGHQVCFFSPMHDSELHFYFSSRVRILIPELISRFVSHLNWPCKPNINISQHIKHTLQQHPHLLNKKMEQASTCASPEP